MIGLVRVTIVIQKMFDALLRSYIYAHVYVYTCYFYQKLPTRSSTDVITVHAWPQNHAYMIVHACMHMFSNCILK